jgi:hypothetical protein
MSQSRPSGLSVTVEEHVLVDLSHWVARAQQYAPSHSSCAELADKMQGALARAFTHASVVEFGVLKDEIMIGERAATHPVLRTRSAPQLHERGVLVLRFILGVTRPELASLVELLTWSAQKTFDSGGLARLLLEHGVVHIQVEELAHDITDEEREEHRRRKRLRTFFSDMLKDLLARRASDQPIGDQLAELLEHPKVAAAVVEEQSRGGIVEAVAGFALMVRQEEARSNVELAPKLRMALLALSTSARDRVVTGFPSLLGEFRDALFWAVDGLVDEDLVRFVLPSVRARASEVDVVLYALSVLVPRDGRRMSIARRVGLRLHDLPEDEATLVLEPLARKPDAFDSFRRERECLSDAAVQALGCVGAVPIPSLDADRDLPAVRARVFAGQRVAADLVRLSATMPHFDRFCARMAMAATKLAEGGFTDAVFGVVRGLSDAPPEQKHNADWALAKIATSPAGEHLLLAIEQATATHEERDLEELVAVTHVIAAHCPEAVCRHLEQSESRKMRRILLDALPLAGGALLPLVRERLQSSTWFVVRNFVALVPRAGGGPSDLEPAVHHTNEKVRLEVTRALRSMPPTSAALDIVVGYLADPSPDVRQTARGLLRGEDLSATAIAALGALIADDKQSDELRQVAIAALSNSASDAAALALAHALQPRGLLESAGAASLRDITAAALRRSRAPSARALFDEGLRSTVRRVRKACERAAGGSNA